MLIKKKSSFRCQLEGCNNFIAELTPFCSWDCLIEYKGIWDIAIRENQFWDKVKINNITLQVQNASQLNSFKIEQRKQEKIFKIVGYVYIIGLENKDGPVKIGMTYGNPSDRLKALQTGNAEKLYLIDFIKVVDPRYYEIILHDKFFLKRMCGEWFDISHDEVKEAFLLINDNIKFIN